MQTVGFIGLGHMGAKHVGALARRRQAISGRPTLSEQLIDVLRQTAHLLLARANLRNIPVPAGRR